MDYAWNRDASGNNRGYAQFKSTQDPYSPGYSEIEMKRKPKKLKKKKNNKEN